MSIKSVIVIAECTKDEIHYDSPAHVGDTLMEIDTITIRGGYGSDFDGTRSIFAARRAWLIGLARDSKPGPLPLPVC